MRSIWRQEKIGEVLAACPRETRISELAWGGALWTLSNEIAERTRERKVEGIWCLEKKVDWSFWNQKREECYERKKQTRIAYSQLLYLAIQISNLSFRFDRLKPTPLSSRTSLIERSLSPSPLMKEATSSSIALKLHFCCNSEAHPSCLSQSKPSHLKGSKPRQKLKKVLKKFCKKSGLDFTPQKLEQYELHKCFCLDGKKEGAGDSEALDLNKRIKRHELKNGDRLFVRRVEMMEVDESQGESNRMVRWQGGLGGMSGSQEHSVLLLLVDKIWVSDSVLRIGQEAGYKVIFPRQ